jgi:hypothetical protein
LVESGSHEELLQQNGLYASLYKLQMLGSWHSPEWLSLSKKHLQTLENIFQSLVDWSQFLNNSS